MQKEKNNIIYSNNNVKAMIKKYNNEIKKSSIGKNVIVATNKKTSIIEIILKFFIKMILFIAVSKSLTRNKTKTNELVDRVYARFTGRDFVFIPISFAFYLLISFIPIMMSVYILLSFLPGDLNVLFTDKILAKIIPGLLALTESWKTKTDIKTYAIVIPLFIAAIWFSSAGFARFIYSLNYIYRHETTGNWFINRFKGFVTVLLIVVFMFIFVSIYLVFYKLFKIDKAPLYKQNIYFYVTFSLFLFATLYIGFLQLFRFTPSFKLTWQQVAPGVLIATIPTMIFITIFGYLTSLINYNKFGIFGIFMYIALLVSNMSYFIFLGIIANEGFYKTYHSRYTISKKRWFGDRIKF